VELAKHHNVDAILSVGGGSVLDSAKGYCGRCTYKGDVWDLFAGKGELSSALPLFAILTLAATGSEMNPYAVVTNEETHEKLSIGNDYTRPVVSVLSPALMAGVSRDYLVYSAADIISHLIEVYFTATVQPAIQSRLVEALLNTVIETTQTLIASPDDEAARGICLGCNPCSKRFDPVRLCRIQLSESCNRALFIRTFQRSAWGRVVRCYARLDEMVQKPKYTAV
jgi:alcohol dehydrogenase YqhD (iron-dependent ADH family)